MKISQSGQDRTERQAMAPAPSLSAEADAVTERCYVYDSQSYRPDSNTDDFSMKQICVVICLATGLGGCFIEARTPVPEDTSAHTVQPLGNPPPTQNGATPISRTGGAVRC
jgi:hypothetical protein